MDMTKENLKKLHLVELKNLCKKYRLHQSGTKSQLINRILEIEKPITPVVHSHPASLTAPDKKIVGVISDDTEKSRQIGKQMEQKKAQFLYYSMGVRYYVMGKDFTFSE